MIMSEPVKFFLYQLIAIGAIAALRHTEFLFYSSFNSYSYPSAVPRLVTLWVNLIPNPKHFWGAGRH